MLARKTCRRKWPVPVPARRCASAPNTHPERLRPAADLPRLRPPSRRRRWTAVWRASRCSTFSATRGTSRTGSTPQWARWRRSPIPCATTPSAWSSRRARRRRSSAPPSPSQRRLRHARTGRAEDRIMAITAALGIPLPDGIEIQNARVSDSNRRYAEFLYGKKQRDGFLFRDCQRLVNQTERLRRLHGRDGGGGCARHRHHAFLCRRRWRASPWRSTRSRGGASSASPSSSPAAPARCWCRHGGARTPGCGDARRHRPRFGGRRAAARARTPRRLPVLLHLRRSARHHPGSIRDIGEAARRTRGGFRVRRGECRLTSRSTPAARLALSLCPLTGPANVLIMPGLHAAHI